MGKERVTKIINDVCHRTGRIVYIFFPFQILSVAKYIYHMGMEYSMIENIHIALPENFEEQILNQDILFYA